MGPLSSLLIALTLFAACSGQTGFFSFGGLVTTQNEARGIPRPLSEVEQEEMLLIHNDKRSRQPLQVNLECFMSTNKTMAYYAQEVANGCSPNVSRDFPYGYGYFSLSGDVKGLNEYVTEASAYGLAFYDPVRKNCATIDQVQCDLFKQVFWYKADELGCGRSLCDGRTVVVCAYTYKQRENLTPYHQVPPPYWRPCSACEPSKSTCMKNLCCSLEERQKKNVNKRPETLTDLTRVWHAATGRNYLVTDSEERRQLITLVNTNYYGVIGQLALQTQRDCAAAKPVYRMHHESLRSEFLTINMTVREEAKARGYKELGIIGAAVANKKECEASIPLYAFVKKSGEIIQLEEGSDSAAMLADHMYDPRGISFWMWESENED